MEGHDGVGLRRIAHETIIHIHLTAQQQGILCHGVADVDLAMRLDLGQVLLVDRIGDVGSRQDCHRYIGYDAVQRTGHSSMYIRS